MCGIVGMFSSKIDDYKRDLFNKSMMKLNHRGPDDQGIEELCLEKGTLLIGHKRLSIIDLSSDGHQPMYSDDGRYIITYNGEIYNYKELKAELIDKGFTFKTDTDTEVLLYCWVHWGHECLQRLCGMFAFVIFDTFKQTITCVRDAFGIKPFFYNFTEDSFYFASEINPLKDLIPHKTKYNFQRLYDYIVLGRYDSQEDTTLTGIKNLQPSHYLTYDINAEKIEIYRWWWPSVKLNKKISFNEATLKLKEIFLKNIRLHMRSDVPIGVALSGGIDSSAIVCAMRYLEPKMVINTFSYVAHGFEKNEEKWIDIINKYVNAIPHKIYFKPSELLDDIEDLIQFQGEPFGGTSIYAQYRVFQFAKQNNIKVMLEGQGADELLAGYKGYPGQKIASLLDQGKIYQSLVFLRNWSKVPGRNYFEGLKLLIENYIPPKLQYLPRKIVNKDIIPNWINKDKLKDYRIKPWESLQEDLPKYEKKRRLMSKLRHLLCEGNISVLLRHGDRNSMRWSIESRVPFLTIEMAEFLLSLPEEYLINDNGQTKYIFREAMRGIVPDEILDRKDKIGFATPENNLMQELLKRHSNFLENLENLDFIDLKKLKIELDLEHKKNKVHDNLLWRLLNASLYLKKQ